MSTRWIAVVGFFTTMLVLGNPVFAGMQWPAGQPPVENPVPQYRPPSKQMPSGRKPIEPAVPNFFEPAPERNRSTVERSGELLATNPLTALRKEKGIHDANAGSAPVVKPLQKRAVKAFKVPALESRPDGSNARSNLGSGSASMPRLPAAQRQPAPARPLAGPSASAPKRTNDKKADAKLPVRDFSIYRDRNPFPIDPRKPCQICTNPVGKCRCLKLGTQGLPYQELEPGGCQCDSKHPWKHPDFSVHWPRPFSARLDQRNPEAAARRYSACPKKPLIDAFDRLSSFKLIDYQRTDNGYCGPDADRYGCLGESKIASGAMVR